MKTNIVMLVCDRPVLTRQSLVSLYENTPKGTYNLTIVDDGSIEADSRNLMDCMVVQFKKSDREIVWLKLRPAIGITGRLRNLGVYFSERHFGRGDYLYLSDNDVFFTRGWLMKLSGALEASQIQLIGGSTHPFHGTNGVWESAVIEVRSHDAVSGYSHLMKWETWDKYGPHDAHAPGVGQSEDWKFCQDIIKDGGRVGTVWPEVVYACGLTNTYGQKATGADQMRRYPGIIQQ